MISLGHTTKQVAQFLWHINHASQLDCFVFVLVELRHQLSGDPGRQGMAADLLKYTSITPNWPATGTNDFGLCSCARLDTATMGSAAGEAATAEPSFPGGLSAVHPCTYYSRGN